jgi:hypothetical protein
MHATQEAGAAPHASVPRGQRGPTSDHGTWRHLLHTAPYNDGPSSKLKRLTKDSLEKLVTGASVKLSECDGVEQQNKNATALNQAMSERLSLVTPSASSKGLACKYCFETFSGNSTRAKLHLALCKCCPDETSILYAQQFATKFEKNGRHKVGDLTVQKGNQCVQFVADYKAAQSRSMKRPAPSSEAGSHKQQRTSIQEYTDRQLTVEQCNKIDIAFAMFIFTMALPLKIISSVLLWEAINLLNSTYAERSKLSEWTLRICRI